MNHKPYIQSALFTLGLILGLSQMPLNATSLSIGADYRLRGVAIEERDKGRPDNDYYDSRLQAYMITDLSKDVEATLRVQSITPWGLEGSTVPLATRYPNANGNLWVQNAFVRLPNIWEERVVVTAGRQPIVWGDGLILSDDELGFNAIRLQVLNPLSAFNWLGPFRKIDFDLDAFTAKIDEGLQTSSEDADLNGVVLGFDQDWNAFNENNVVRWELMSLWENDNRNQMYEVGAATLPVMATKIKRHIIGIRAKGTLKDAYIKGEYYRQMGDVSLASGDIGLKGDAYVIGLGGKANTKNIGRFGALLEFMEGSGDSEGTTGDDEAFRAPRASRWDGLERKGKGNYFAANFSDVYQSTNPFSEVTSVNDGLPGGVSGIQTLHFGVEATPWAKWTFTFDFYQYKARKTSSLNLVEGKEIGSEFDYGFIYRYSGLVTVRGTLSQFKSGDVFEQTTRQDGEFAGLEILVSY